MSDPERWVDIEGTSASCRSRCELHEDVPVLCVWLRGSVSRHDDEVSNLAGGLDELASSVGDRAEVAVLNTLEFSNAGADEDAHLTSVFAGLPCCWVSSDWYSQDEHGRRWDLPLPAKLAGTHSEAVARVVALRKAGQFETHYARDREPVLTEWAARGLLVTDRHEGRTSLFHHNREVERIITRLDGEPTKVAWPFPDRVGTPSEAMERSARLVFRGARLTDINLSASETGRVAGPQWPNSLIGAQHLEYLGLIGVPATDSQVLVILEQFSNLKDLSLDHTRVTAQTMDAIARGAGPALERVSRFGTSVKGEQLEAYRTLRPGLIFS